MTRRTRTEHIWSGVGSLRAYFEIAQANLTFLPALAMYHASGSIGSRPAFQRHNAQELLAACRVERFVTLDFGGSNYLAFGVC